MKKGNVIIKNAIPVFYYPMEGKVFKEIDDTIAEGIRRHAYVICTDGTIYSFISNKYIELTINTQGYYVANLRLQQYGSKVFFLHRMLMIAFKYIPNYKEMMVNHINGIKTDCRLDNMEWVTVQANNFHAKISGNRTTGEKCNWSKLTDSQVFEIIQRVNNGQYQTFEKLGLEYGVSSTCISEIMSRKIRYNETSNIDILYKPREHFSEEQVKNICKIFEMNKDKDWPYLYYIVIFCMNLPDNRNVRMRILKIYKRENNYFKNITDQYDF